MSEKQPKPGSEAELKQRREALDRVLKAALAESNDMIRIYDCAVWLLYACARDDARATASEELENEEPEETEDRLAHTVKDELVDTMDMVHDDRDAAVGIWEDAGELGKLLDPGFDQPILPQPDWLNNPEKIHKLMKKRKSTR